MWREEMKKWWLFRNIWRVASIVAITFLMTMTFMVIGKTETATYTWQLPIQMFLLCGSFWLYGYLSAKEG